MRPFLQIWVGQLLSLMGTSTTRFALGLWAWQLTGQASALALALFFSYTPTLLLSPVAGALVDRWSRKWVLLATDASAGVATLMLLGLYQAEELQLWHIYMAVMLQGAADAFQSPAYTASITLLVPATHYERANGLTSFAESARDIAAPLLAGLLLPLGGLALVLLLDLLSFGVALATLALTPIPQAPTTRRAVPSLLHDSWTGFHYLRGQPGLRALLGLMFLRNLTNTFAWAVFIPMILARTGNNLTAAGIAEAMLGVGGVVGTLLVSLRGQPAQAVQSIMLHMALKSLLGTLLIGLGASLPIWALGAFCSAFFHPLFSAPSTAIWQRVVAAELQGRVFATRRLITLMTLPLSLLLVGPAADYLFEPAMQPQGILAPLLGWMIRPGAGAGMQLMHILAGLAGLAFAWAGWRSAAIRRLEQAQQGAAVRQNLIANS